jgi:superfamily II DNA/RNA helicase
VLDAISDNANYYMNASADPVKNDSSEAFSLLQKMDPERYRDRDAFMRRYGVDTLAARDGLRRELARFQYPSRIDPDITATRKEHKVALSEEQTRTLADLEKTVAQVRLARMAGKVDVEAVKRLSPHSFAGVPADQQEAVARNLQDSLGIIKESATRSIINGGAKVDAVSRLVGERHGKPGVVFAHSLAAVEAVGKRLAEDGYKIVTITGRDTARSKAAKAQMFNPQVGEAKADVLVASDAAATGLNAQRGQYVINLDTPDTAKTHAQRNGRVDRIGQEHDVELIDVVADHPDEARARKRLANKYALRDLMTTPMEGLDDTGLAYFLRQRQVDADARAVA